MNLSVGHCRVSEAQALLATRIQRRFGKDFYWWNFFVCLYMQVLFALMCLDYFQNWETQCARFTVPVTLI